MIHDRIFIITASRNWDRAYGNDVRAMAGEIALQNKVLYVNPPANGGVSPANPSSGDALAGGNEQIVSPKDNIWVVDMPAMTMPASTTHSEEDFNALNESNSMRYADVVRRTAAKLGIDWNNSYLLLDNDLPMSSYLAELLPARFSLFYRNDRALPESLSQHRASKLNQDTARNADIVITNSVQLAADLRQYNYNTYNIGKGMDLSGYQLDKEYPRPEDIADIDTPIVGCAGTISSLYLSPTMVYQMAASLPGVTIVMLGNKDPLIVDHPVHHLPNVRFLGAKSGKDLPAYISAFDVCVDPSVNKHPNSLYRNAIVDYLALGKTVVCSDMEHARPFNEYVMIAESEQDFIGKVISGLHTRTPWSIRYKRAEFARTFSWGKCVERLYVVIRMAETDRAMRSGGAAAGTKSAIS